ncbi:MAG: 16S rRNA (adenine(1518)-N(6)/adenine(1519)-N(6))-dimethyltransferase RsmA [Pseudomonadota bacterium]
MSARRRRLGQHFLRHPGAVKAVVAAADLSPQDTVVEVGPGTGVLTVPLAREAGKVLAVELDEGLLPRLREWLAESGVANVEIIEEDILRYDFQDAFERHGPLKVVGNLPYSVSSPVLFRLLGMRHAIPLAVLMFQREVADRVSAPPGGKDYGVLSVLVQQAALVERVIDLDEKHFQPPPKVKSAVLKLSFPSVAPQPVVDQAAFVRVVKAAFGQRRKTLHNALRSLGISPEWIDQAITETGLAPSIRAERLSVAEFARLAEALAARGHPDHS